VIATCSVEAKYLSNRSFDELVVVDLYVPWSIAIYLNILIFVTLFHCLGSCFEQLIPYFTPQFVQTKQRNEAKNYKKET